MVDRALFLQHKRPESTKCRPVPGAASVNHRGARFPPQPTVAGRNAPTRCGDLMQPCGGASATRLCGSLVSGLFAAPGMQSTDPQGVHQALQSPPEFVETECHVFKIVFASKTKRG